MTRLLAILSLSGVLLGGAAALAQSGTDRTAVFQVEGMTCGLCAKAIEKALRDVEGVRQVDVDRKTERVTVVADTGLTFDRLEQAIESAGSYEAELLEGG
ncbi:MAG: heavy metal-associated domain-containing protein [Myxococcota bacterium]